jgi:hypothetical protein
LLLCAALFAAPALSVAPVRAQCVRSCALGQARDPYGCCIQAPARRPRRPSELRPEALVGDASSVLADDAATELYHWARAFLAQARELDGTSHARAVWFFRQAAGTALVFITLAPDDPRAGRMRVVLVQGLDGAGLVDEGEREAAALGGPRPAAESPELRTLRADTMLNRAWAHRTLAARLDVSPYAEPRSRASSRYRRAADYYALYVEAFPEGSETAGAQSELANALSNAGDPAAAARVFEELAASRPDRRYEALPRAIGALSHALALEVQSGTTVLRSDPPPPSQRPPFAEPIAFPPALQRLFDLRERYLNERGDPVFSRAQNLENTLWLYRYGHFAEAERRLSALLIDRCDDGVARNAWTILASLRRDPVHDPTPAEVCSLRNTRCADAPNTPECVASRAAP